MSRVLIAWGLLLLWTAPAVADDPEPIELVLSPAKPPAPPLRYRLLPDARHLTAGDAAVAYRQALAQVADNSFQETALRLSAWREKSLALLPRDEVRKELAGFAKVFELLDKAGNCDHCDWGLRERLRAKGIGALMTEAANAPRCGLLLSLKARLEMAEGHPEKALGTLRTGFALARNIGDAEPTINVLVGISVAADLEQDLDLLLGLPDAPNLYPALTNLPRPLFSFRKALDGDRLCMLEGTFPRLGGIATNLEASDLTPEELRECTRMVDGLGRLNEHIPPPLCRLYLAWDIARKDGAARRALVEAGRPPARVAAMSPIQVAYLHALLEYETVLDKSILFQDLPYPELEQRAAELDRVQKERWLDPQAPAVPLAPLVVPALRKLAFAVARADRKIALLRTVEALRYHAALHGELPPSLDRVVVVPVPLDPVTGRAFEYRREGDTVTLYAPPPGKEKPNRTNSVVYELRLRREKGDTP